MITAHTFNLEEGRAREDATMLHIGRMTVRAAAIDEVATTVLARVLAPSGDETAHAAFAPEMFGIKFRFLERVLPTEWPDRKPLLSAMRKIEEYRNRLAHSTVHTLYSLVEGTERTRLHNVKGGWAEVNPIDFASWEARAHVTLGVLEQLSYEDDPNPQHHTARDLLAYYFGDSDLPGIAEAIDELFPAA